MNKKYNISLFLFTRDLRIVDNVGLEEAHKSSNKIIPIFIFTDSQINQSKNKYKSNKSVQFMIESLDDLEQSIENQNGNLLCFSELSGNKNREKLLSYLIQKYSCDALFMNDDYTPYAKSRRQSIEKLCKSHTIDFHTYHDVSLYKPGSIITGNNNYYQKFTPFYNVCIKQNIEQPTSTHNFHWFQIQSTEKKALQNIVLLRDIYVKYTDPSIDSLLEGGRNNGLTILRNMKGFQKYDSDRNTLHLPTTQLSAYLKYGCISTRETFYSMKKHFGLKSGLIRQLIWRDFYLHLVDGFPRVLQGKSLKEKYDSIKWDNNSSYIKAWKEGKTGFPIVDACMRQLNTSGYMHNRGRLITASFLIKLLLVDWRIGEKYFAQNLIDYDPASNNGNWQWVSGSGADSQPYFRIFNTWTQSEKHDTDAIYIKKWLPELIDVEPKHLHNWDKWFDDEKYKHIKYPKPIIEYESQREKALELYKKYV